MLLHLNRTSRAASLARSRTVVGFLGPSGDVEFLQPVVGSGQGPCARGLWLLTCSALLFVKACAAAMGFAFQRKDPLTEVTLINGIKAEVLCSPRPPSRPSGPGKAQAVSSPGSPRQQAANLQLFRVESR